MNVILNLFFYTLLNKYKLYEKVLVIKYLICNGLFYLITIQI